MDFLIKALQLILSLSILVILHEFGHFFFARLFKTRVEKFYLFFDPWFSLFKFKKGDTEYGVGWLPLGGYVKISGMIDESMDKEQLEQPAQPWEFRAKPTWQRLLIMIGGVSVNFITAMVIFWLILFKWGESYIPAENAKYGFTFHPIAHEIGLLEGDRVLMVDTLKIDNVQLVGRYIMLEEPSHMTVLRGDSTLQIQVPADLKKRLLAEEVRQFADYRYPVIVDSVIPGMGAAQAGLLKNDSIYAVNGVNTTYFKDMVAELARNIGKTVDVGIYRGADTLTLPILVNDLGKIGFGSKSPSELLGYKTVEYGFFEALPAGIDKGVNLLVNYVKQLKLVFTREGAKQIGGFGAIGNLFPNIWDWESFWYNTAFLSLILAFMNILPIPALDGGHVLFLVYEMVTRRKPSEKFMEYAQITGMILLFGLLIYANGNDLFRHFFK
jgi:regulator of sigma E protease